MINFSPPIASAGNTLTTSRPRAAAFCTSLGVAQPGITGIFLLIQYFTNFSSIPGLTINLAPAATARSTCSVVITVPAPITIFGYSSDMILIASSAQSVRNVTSAQGSPPVQRALPSGLASSACFNATTGTIPIFERVTNTSFIEKTSFSL